MHIVSSFEGRAPQCEVSIPLSLITYDRALGAGPVIGSMYPLIVVFIFIRAEKQSED